MLDRPALRGESPRPMPTTPTVTSSDPAVDDAGSHRLENAPKTEPSSPSEDPTGRRCLVRSTNIVSADSANRTVRGTNVSARSKIVRARTSGSGSVSCSAASANSHTPLEAACAADTAARTLAECQSAAPVYPDAQISPTTRLLRVGSHSRPTHAS